MPIMIVGFQTGTAALRAARSAGRDRTPRWSPMRPAGVGRLAGLLGKRWRAARTRRAAAGELAAMSDGELADMCINRSDLRRVFDPAFGAEHARRGAPAI